VRVEQDVAGDDRLLGDTRPAGQTENAGQRSLVHLRALGQPRLLRVLRDRAAERLHVLERAAHQGGVPDAVAVVGEHPYARRRVRHRAQLGELGPLPADRDRADRVDIGVPGLAAEAPDLLDDTGGVGDRIGVGHREHRGEPAERRGPGAGEDGLGVLATGLPQVRVQVDETRQRDQPLRIDGPGVGRRLEVGADGNDLAVVDQQVRHLTAQDLGAGDQVRGHAVCSSSLLPDNSR
jgi:hypothetical protein